jgi:hypothetical protein
MVKELGRSVQPFPPCRIPLPTCASLPHSSSNLCLCLALHYVKGQYMDFHDFFQVATDKCIMAFLFLIVCIIIAVIVTSTPSDNKINDV